MKSDERVEVLQGLSAKLSSVARDLRSVSERLLGISSNRPASIDDSIDLDERLAAAKMFVSSANLGGMEIGRRDGTAMTLDELLAMAELGVACVKGTRVVPTGSIIRVDGPLMPGKS